MKNINLERLQNFPISFFTVTLGLAGFSIATQKMENLLNAYNTASFIMGIISIMVFLIIASLYLAKFVMYPKDAYKEFNHPIKINFFPAISISLILFSIVFREIHLEFSKYLLIIGSVIHFALTLIVLSSWVFHEKYNLSHLNPSWFIPVVGNVLVPITGYQYIGFELSFMFFSVGIFFWIILTILFFNKIIFDNGLQEKFMPTLFILIAPPAVGFVSITTLLQDLTFTGLFLYNVALFFFIFLIVNISRFSKIPFYLSWWAYSFPIAAMSIASYLLYVLSGNSLYKIIFTITYIILIFAMTILTYKTIISVLNKKICIKED